jgi:tRNA uridine 5-carboxymethylaminomethyl modification enzyme
MQRQSADIAEVRRDEDRAIPDDFDFEIMSGLSNELKQKLKTFRPSNVAQAAKLDGMTPAALSLLLVHLRRNKSDILQSA